MATGDPPQIDELLQTLALQHTEDLSFTETIRPNTPLTKEQLVTSSLPRLFRSEEGDALLDLELLGILGEGGMGQVQLARQHSLKREVALKRLKATRKSAGNVSSLLEEARRTGMLEHPNIIPVHAVGLDEEDLPVIVMKRVEGTSWRTLLQNPKHPSWQGVQDPITRHIEIVMQVCNAVHFAHSRGLIHRDIKPENIMIGDFGEVYLLDWGLSYKPTEDKPSKNVVGTLAYMAPEMLNGSAEICPQTDVYLLGSSLHEALTNEPRHNGSSIKEVACAISLSLPIDYDEGIPAELAAICNKAMHADPKRRYESALLLREALAAFLRHRSSVSVSNTAHERLKEAQALKEKPDLKRLYKLFAEARFGFEQALRLWEENKAAQEGLSTCLRLLFEQELSQRNVTAAEILLSEIPNPAPALREQLQRLKLQLEEELQEQKRLSEFSHQFDLTVSSRQRLQFALAIAAFLSLLSITFLIVRAQSDSVGSYPMHIGAALAGFLFLSLLTYLGKNSLLKTDINRRLIYSILCGTAVLPVIRFQAMMLSVPIESLVAFELLLLGTGMSILGVSLQRGLFISAALLFTGSLGTTVFPSLWLEFWMASYISFMLSVAYVWMRTKARP